MKFIASENYRLKKMARMAKKGAVLDIGCSEMPNPFIKGVEVIGFDLNDGKLSSNYNDLIIGDVYELPKGLEGKTFDTVIIGEVIEHVKDPVEFIRCCTSVLKPNGRIILSTPNPHSTYEWFFNISLNQKYMFSEEHITIYPQRYLLRMMKLAGLTDIKLRSGGIQVPFAGIGSNKNFPFFGLIPFPRPFCYQTIAIGTYRK